MSGFAGVVRTDGETPDPKLLERIAGQLVFRGPDATNVSTQPGAGFSFTLLRTGPAPRSDTQPCTLDGQLWLLGDIRLDGREALLEWLKQTDAEASEHLPDEELVLRVWRRSGEHCLERLTGDFSFAIWDSQAKRLICVRDLIGARPFFYSDAADQLFFSNTLQALRQWPEISSKLDPYFIADFLLQSWSDDPERTAFLGIRRLPAGHILTYANNESSVRRYASLPIEEPLSFKRPQDCIDEFRTHVERAVRDRLPHCGAGVFMSGGLDSTAVAAVASKVQASRRRPDTVRAYTVDYSPLFDDQEGQFASRAAKHIGVPIEIMSGSDCAPFAGWDEFSIRTPEPCAEPFFALHVQHYRQLGASSRVALTGDGGDDLLAGRAWPHLMYLSRRGQIASLARVFGGYALRHGKLPPLRAGLRGRLRRWLGHAEESVDYPTWLEPSFEKEFHLRERWRELQAPYTSNHPLHPAGYASLSSAFWPTVYETEDAGWTGVAVEARAPLLDVRLIRFLLRVPPVPWCMDKFLLREAMIGSLPDTVRRRRKTPLRGDPLLLQSEKNGWRAVLPAESCGMLSMFVNCRMLSATSLPAPGLSLWNQIRPIALHIWLKHVENNVGIKYSRIGGN